MDVFHPHTNYEVAELRREERLARAARARLLTVREDTETMRQARHVGIFGRMLELIGRRGVSRGEAVARTSHS